MGTESLPVERPISQFEKRRSSCATITQIHPKSDVKRSRSSSMVRGQLEEWRFGRIGTNFFDCIGRKPDNIDEEEVELTQKSERKDTTGMRLHTFRRHSILSGTDESARRARLCLNTINFIAKLK